MDKIQEVITGIIKREGGVRYENVPGDRGGPTKGGITLDRLRTERGGKITAQDVQDLTEDEIREIYADAYFLRPRIDRLPKCLQVQVMDFFTTSGNWAIKKLQQMINDFDHKCDVDGKLGPQTIRLCWEITATAPEHVLNNAYVEARATFYRRIVQSDASQGKFLKGWLNRAHSFKMQEPKDVA